MAMARGLDFSELSSPGGISSSFSALNEDTRQTIGFDAAASAGLFVGVRQFVDEMGQPSEELQRIPFAVDDAIDLAALFVLELALLQASRVKLLLSGEPQKPASQAALAALRAAGAQVDEASYTKVLAGIRTASGSALPEGLLLISVATHGFSLEDDRLLCADSNRSDLEDTSISLSKLQRLLTASPSPRRLLLVDACREQVELSRGIGAPANQLSDALGRVEGLAVLCAAPPRGFSFDDPDRQNGVFTSRVLEGLRSGASANAEGLVTLQSLALWVDQQVVAWIKANKPQLPSTQGITLRLEPQGIGNLPLAARPTHPPAVKPSSPGPEASPGPEDPPQPPRAPFPLAWRQHLKTRCSELESLLEQSPRFRLEEVFVDRTLIYSPEEAPAQAPPKRRLFGAAPIPTPAPRATPDAASRPDIEAQPPTSILELLSHPRVRQVILEGGPGSGKSTSLRWIALMAAHQEDDGPVPLFFELTTFAAWLLERTADLDGPETLIQWAGEKLAIMTKSSEPPPWVCIPEGPRQKKPWTWREMSRSGAATPGTGPIKMHLPMAAPGSRGAMQHDGCSKAVAGSAPKLSFGQPIASGARWETGLEIPGSGQS